MCEKVFYYKRPAGLKYFFSSIPYIVKTRSPEELLGNLEQLPFPILFEGIHTTGFHNHKALNTRHKIIRTHNIEYKYYRNLTRSEKNLFRKFFFLSESVKLNRYEKRLSGKIKIAAISENDKIHYRQCGYDAHYIPAFHPFDTVMSLEGTGDYILYHGDLSVPDNEKSAMFIIEKIDGQTRFPLIVAGKDPSEILKKAGTASQNIKIIENPSSGEMSDLIMNAHINLLHSYQATGIKIKLLYSLFQGRHCLVHKNVIINSGLDDLCHTWETDDQLIEKIRQLTDKSFTKAESEKRNKKLHDNFSNRKNITQLLRLAGLDM